MGVARAEGGIIVATVKCKLKKRGEPTHEWNDGEKDRIYCRGWLDHMTDPPLPECLACPDHVDLRTLWPKSSPVKRPR